jgi:hypothetical protein
MVVFDMLLGALFFFHPRPNPAPAASDVRPLRFLLGTDLNPPQSLRPSVRSVLRAPSAFTYDSLFVTLCNKSEAQLFLFHADAHSSQKHRDGTQTDSSIFRSPNVYPDSVGATHHSPLSPLEATLTKNRGEGEVRTPPTIISSKPSRVAAPFGFKACSPPEGCGF